MLCFSIGKRYRGKTTEAYHLMRSVPARIIFDPRHDFDLTGARVAAGSEASRAELDALFAGEYHDLVVRPRHGMDEQVQSLCKGLQTYADARFQFGLLLDEARLYRRTLAEPNSPFDDLIRHGSKNLIVVLTTHAVVDIHPDLRRIGDLWCIFQTTHQADLKTIYERIGDDAIIEQIRTLKSREFISWDDGEGTARVHKDPSAWAVPGLKTQSLDVGEPLHVLPSAERRARHLFDEEEIGENL